MTWGGAQGSGDNSYFDTFYQELEEPNGANAVISEKELSHVTQDTNGEVLPFLWFGPCPYFCPWSEQPEGSCFCLAPSWPAQPSLILMFCKIMFNRRTAWLSCGCCANSQETKVRVSMLLSHSTVITQPFTRCPSAQKAFFSLSSPTSA